MAESNREDEGNRGVENEAGSGECGDLQMSPEAMLDLARRPAELLVSRTENLPEAALEELNKTVLARVFWEDRAFFRPHSCMVRFH